MLFTGRSRAWGTNSINFVPIISLAYDYVINTTINGLIIQDKSSIVRKLNPARHCWATFTILPENYGLFEGSRYQNFMQLPSFIHPETSSHYFILMTAAPREIKTFLTNPNIFVTLHQMEIILIDLSTIEDFSLVPINYFNNHHIQQPKMGWNGLNVGKVYSVLHSIVSICWVHSAKMCQI